MNLFYNLEARSGSKQFDTLIEFVKEFFKQLIVKKATRWQ